MICSHENTMHVFYIPMIFHQCQGTPTSSPSSGCPPGPVAPHPPGPWTWWTGPGHLQTTGDPWGPLGTKGPPQKGRNIQRSWKFQDGIQRSDKIYMKSKGNSNWIYGVVVKSYWSCSLGSMHQAVVWWWTSTSNRIMICESDFLYSFPILFGGCKKINLEIGGTPKGYWIHFPIWTAPFSRS